MRGRDQLFCQLHPEHLFVNEGDDLLVNAEKQGLSQGTESLERLRLKLLDAQVRAHGWKATAAGASRSDRRRLKRSIPSGKMSPGILCAKNGLLARHTSNIK